MDINQLGSVFSQRYLGIPLSLQFWSKQYWNYNQVLHSHIKSLLEHKDEDTIKLIVDDRANCN